MSETQQNTEQKTEQKTEHRTRKVLRKVGNWTKQYGWLCTGPLMYSAFLFGVVVTERVYMGGKNKAQLRS